MGPLLVKHPKIASGLGHISMVWLELVPHAACQSEGAWIQGKHLHIALLLAPGRECDGELNSTDPACGKNGGP
jgi:hypothetical protein